jgi:hypothetical protein
MDIKFRMKIRAAEDLDDLANIDGIIFHRPTSRQKIVKKHILSVISQSAIGDVRAYCARSNYQSFVTIAAIRVTFRFQISCDMVE